MSAIPASHHFDHEAMNTTFHLHICGDDPQLIGGMARECFEEVDLLEGKLSRFLEDSDISRINQMTAGQQLFISEECYDCLRLALQYLEQTGGLFDITLGRSIEHQKNQDPGLPPAISGILAIDPERPMITCHEPGRELDLGGIGKGFALDHMKKCLLEWGAESALLAAGASSQLAFGPQVWPIDLSGDQTSHRLSLKDQALSASGTGIQGAHIVHPDGPEHFAQLPWKRVWLTAPTATAADVWSTTVMLMSRDQLPALAGEIGELFVETRDGAIEARPL